MLKRIVMTAVAAFFFGLAAAFPAHAQVPGNNGLIVFSSTRDGNSQIYTTTSTGLTVDRLTNNAANDTDPAYSPDGSRIAFVSDRDGDREIYVMDADGSNQTRITNHAGDDMDPAWSPDGSRLAIRRSVSGDNEIFLIDAADGGNPVNLTNDPASDFEPEFAPGGGRIAFQRYTAGSGTGFGNEIYIMNADGSAQTNLTANDNSINDGRPSFSPDGSAIAFDSNRNDSRFELYTMKPDGTDVARLTNEAGNRQNAAFSPDGDRIAFGGGSGLDGIGVATVISGATALITSDQDSKPDWQVDVTAPVTAINAGPADGSTETVGTAEFAFDANEPESTFECRLDPADGGDWTPCTSPQSYTGLGDGEHSFQVRAIDLGGNTEAAGPSRTWQIDTTAPVVTFGQTPPTATTSTAASFEFAADDPGAVFECRLDSSDEADWAACVSPVELTGLGESAHTFEVRASDPVGNVSGVVSHGWTVDLTAPTLSIDVAPPVASNSVRASFEFSADEPVDFECRLDSSDEAGWAACDSPVDLDDLADGSHVFEVRGSDAAGNAGAVVSHSWDVTTVKPVASITSGPTGTVADTSATFEFTADLGSATFECRLDSDEPAGWSACSSPATFDSLVDGEHTLEVRATDLDQGTGPVASQTWTVDTVAPTVDLTGTPAPISGTADPEFAFVANESGTTAECRIDPADLSDPWAACSSPVSYTGLAEGEHRFEVRVTDAAGHVSAVVAYDWIVETTPPQVTITSELPEDPTTFINATFEFGSTNSNAFFECRFDGGSWATCASPFEVDQLADGEHTFTVRAVGHGAGPGPEETVSWHVDTTVPTVLITAGPQSVTTRTDADFEFGMNKPGFTFQCSLDGAAATPCSSPVSLSGLNAGSHTFQVDALDQASQVVDSASQDWTILAAAPEVDIAEAPASVAGSSTAAFSFSSDEPAAGFECQLDTGAWQVCTSPAAFTGLADGSHTVRIRTTLPDPPASPIHGPAVEHTWQVDTTAPVVTITGGPNGTVTATSATFQITSDDASATTECSIDQGSWVACDGELALTGLGSGDHQLRVRSVDSVGNTGSDHREWSIDSVAPVTTLTETPETPTTERSAQFDFSADKAGVVFECRVDGGEWSSCSPVLTIDNLELGAHKLEVRATDQHGNTGQAVSFDWEVVKPPVKGLVPSVKISKSVKLDSDGSARVARIECPEGVCRVSAPKRVTFKVKGKKGSPGIKVIRTDFTGRTDATLISSGRVRKLVAKHGPVKIKLRIKVVSDNGKSRIVTKSVKLTAKK